MPPRGTDEPGGKRPQSTTVSSKTERKSDQFLASLADASRVTFVSHVCPDPDSLGSMMGLAHLVETCLGKPTRLTRDGLVSRAENRAMVELLDIELTPVDYCRWAESEAVVMVDSQPNTGRHNIDDDIPLVAVIDHHTTPGDLDDMRFVDVRRKIGATCSIVTQYLIEQEVEIPKRIANGLFYGIETEVGGYPREAGPLDEASLLHLYPLCDRDLLSQIRHARLPLCHFETVLLALQNSFVYDRLIISWIDELPNPELAAAVCDFLIRFEEVDWALCAGVHGDQLLLSARTTLRGANAGDILRGVVGRMGKAGGHDRRAGGSVNLPSTSPSAVEEVQAELRRRLLKALKIDECRGQRLVPLREMLQNLQS
jgi:nanoRNase/pAp phosphatase (c-di-AMP/oligoRNAs hydrolase)